MNFIKKAICAFLTILMFFALLSMSVSAADKSKAAYKVNWSSLSYNTYWYKQKNDDIDSHYTVSKTENSISFQGRSGNERRSYVAKERIEINSNTKYEYVFQAKNSTFDGSAGVVFAFADGLPYFMYGSFDNSSGDSIGMSDIRVQKGLNDHSSHNCSTGYTRSYIKVELDSDGYGTYKIAMDGYRVLFYGLTDSVKETYELVGNAITLPSDAKVAFGAYNRENNSSGQRTITIRNAVLYAMNDEAAQKLSGLSDGSIELSLYIEQIENEYPKENYVPESYSDLATVLSSAKRMLASGNYTASQIADARADIEDALLLLEFADPDFTELEKIIAKAEALVKAECNPTAYGMLMAAVENAKELFEDDDVIQTQVDEAVAVILARYREIVPEEEDTEEVTKSEAPDYGLSGSDAIYTETADGYGKELGCRSAVVGSSVILASAVLFVSALAVRKRED